MCVLDVVKSNEGVQFIGEDAGAGGGRSGEGGPGVGRAGGASGASGLQLSPFQFPLDS